MDHCTVLLPVKANKLPQTARTSEKITDSKLKIKEVNRLQGGRYEKKLEQYELPKLLQSKLKLKKLAKTIVRKTIYAIIKRDIKGKGKFQGVGCAKRRKIT